MRARLEALAQHLWDTGQQRPHSPSWEMLGDITKGVWLERAQLIMFGDLL